MQRKILTIAIPLLAVAIGYLGQDRGDSGDTGDSSYSDNDGNQRVASAFAQRDSGVVLSFSGRVERVLVDDNDGSRHQRFIVVDDSGVSVLISHNIDLAPRIDALRVGDVVSVRGEYEWNERGGLIHWTHHDPRGTHEAGWIRHAGKEYQ